MTNPTIGIIGGSGLYDMAELTDREEKTISTPFGDPSGAYLIGTLRGKRVAFLARHGAGHRLLPSELNFRANIYGMKVLGVERILSVSAVGSLKEEHKPLEFVLPDQFIDRTRHRVDTFFGEGVVVHVGFADPVCPEVSKIAQAAGQKAGVTAKLGGTYVCMEGPQFSTRAESNLYRSWGADVIGMTNLQEAKLCYSTIAMVTDYDCWHDSHESVSVDQIVAVLLKNAENACALVKHAVAAMPKERSCKCSSALANAILTDKAKIPMEVKQRMNLLLGKYIGEKAGA